MRKWLSHQKNKLHGFRELFPKSQRILIRCPLSSLAFLQVLYLKLKPRASAIGSKKALLESLSKNKIKKQKRGSQKIF
jgi:hypothetical protein